MIRRAGLDDLPALVAMCREFFAEGVLSRFARWDDDHCEVGLMGLMSRPDVVVLVAERDGVALGTAGFVVGPHWFDPTTLMATELFWWVRPGHRNGAGARLLLALEIEARNMGAAVLDMRALNMPGGATVSDLLVRRGYEPAETAHLRRL